MKAPKAVKPMSMMDRVVRLVALNAKRKEIEREEAALKDWFKKEAGEVDTAFTDVTSGGTVKVTWKETSRLDKAKVVKLVGEEAVAKCYSSSSYAEVSVGGGKAAA